MRCSIKTLLELGTDFPSCASLERPFSQPLYSLQYVGSHVGPRIHNLKLESRNKLGNKRWGRCGSLLQTYWTDSPCRLSLCEAGGPLAWRGEKSIAFPRSLGRTRSAGRGSGQQPRKRSKKLKHRKLCLFIFLFIKYII